MLIRVLSAVFATLLFGLAIPIAGILLLDTRLGGPAGFWTAAAIGGLIGAFLGWRFPKVFGFIFETIIDA